MKIARDNLTSYSIRKVERGLIVIGDRQYAGNLGLLPDRLIENWPDRPLAELDMADLQKILDHAPEMVLAGTGWSNVLPPRELVFALARRGIGLEVMDTPAACRTFNILVGEGRRPAALLYLDV